MKLKNKIFLISNSTLDELFNDTTHISLRRIYRSAKKCLNKKPFEYIVLPPKSVVENSIPRFCYNQNVIAFFQSINLRSGLFHFDDNKETVSRSSIVRILVFFLVTIIFNGFLSHIIFPCSKFKFFLLNLKINSSNSISCVRPKNKIIQNNMKNNIFC